MWDHRAAIGPWLRVLTAEWRFVPTVERGAADNHSVRYAVTTTSLMIV